MAVSIDEDLVGFDFDDDRFLGFEIGQRNLQFGKNSLREISNVCPSSVRLHVAREDGHLEEVGKISRIRQCRVEPYSDASICAKRFVPQFTTPIENNR